MPLCCSTDCALADLDEVTLPGKDQIHKVRVLTDPALLLEVKWHLSMKDFLPTPIGMPAAVPVE